MTQLRPNTAKINVLIKSVLQGTSVTLNGQADTLKKVNFKRKKGFNIFYLIQCKYYFSVCSI